MMRLSKSAWFVGVIGIATLMIGYLASSHRIKEITMNASIDHNYSYSVKVSYSSSVDTFFCNSYSLFGGKSSESKELRYRPKMVSGRQIVSLPINKLSPVNGCKWLPRYVSLCVQDNANPQISGCSTLFYVSKSNNVSSGTVVDSSSSSFERPIKINCEKSQYEQTRLWCRSDPPLADGTHKPSYSSGDLVIFPGVKGNRFPFDQEDVYWLDISFVPADEEVMESEGQK